MVTLEEILEELKKIKETNKKVKYLKEILKKIKDKKLKEKIEELIEELEKTLEEKLEAIEIRRPQEPEIEQITPKQDYKKTSTEETSIPTEEKEEKSKGYGSSPSQYLTADEPEIGEKKLSPLARKIKETLEEDHLLGEEIHMHSEQKRIIADQIKEYAPNMDYEDIKKYTDEISNSMELQYHQKDKKRKKLFEL